jgi:hypothetical protein
MFKGVKTKTVEVLLLKVGKKKNQVIIKELLCSKNAAKNAF